MGPTLLGGAVGAAIGIAIHVALEVFAHVQAPWVAVIIGLLTGLGVRKATQAKHPGASYARGALSAILGLAAIVASPQVVTKVLQSRGTNVVTVTAAPGKNDDADAKGGKGDDAKAADADDAKVDGSVGDQLRGNPDSTRSGYMAEAHRAKQNGDMWQFIYMAVGAFLAYELGRGSEKKGSQPAEPVVMTDPSN